MSSGMNAEKAKELASKRNYKWAVGNLKMAYGISYKKATKILLYELAEIADRLVFCKDCMHWDDDSSKCTKWTTDTYEQAQTNADAFCSYGERIGNE